MQRVEPITITDSETGETYSLEFDRETVRKAENAGFSLEDIGRYPSKAYDLFFYAFMKNHGRDFATRRLTRKRTDELLDALGGPLDAPPELWERLGDLYIQTYAALGDEKNCHVTVKF